MWWVCLQAYSNADAPDSGVSCLPVKLGTDSCATLSVLICQLVLPCSLCPLVISLQRHVQSEHKLAIKDQLSSQSATTQQRTTPPSKPFPCALDLFSSRHFAVLHRPSPSLSPLLPFGSKLVLCLTRQYLQLVDLSSLLSSPLPTLATQHVHRNEAHLWDPGLLHLWRARQAHVLGAQWQGTIEAWGRASLESQWPQWTLSQDHHQAAQHRTQSQGPEDVAQQKAKQSQEATNGWLVAERERSEERFWQFTLSQPALLLFHYFFPVNMCHFGYFWYTGF